MLLKNSENVNSHILFKITIVVTCLYLSECFFVHGTPSYPEDFYCC